jgi:hypothetical protein
MTDASFDWGSEIHVSPWKLVSLKAACFDLGITENSLLRLAAQYGVPVIRLSARKRSFLARDLMRLVADHAKDTSSYSVNTKVAAHG